MKLREAHRPVSEELVFSNLPSQLHLLITVNTGNALLWSVDYAPSLCSSTRSWSSPPALDLDAG